MLCLTLAPGMDAHAAAVIGQAAPDFTLKTLPGENLRLKEQRGDVVLLGFWASWCSHCPAALEQMQTYATRHRDAGLSVLAVGLDRHTEKLRHMAKDAGLSFPVLYDPFDQIGARYSVESLPTWYLIDREGIVRGVYQRFGATDLAPLDTLLPSLLKP